MNIDAINDWLGMTDVASQHGPVLNHGLAVIHWFMAILGIGWTLFLIYIIWKFRVRKHSDASYSGVTSHFSTHLEVGVVIVEIVLLLGFAFPVWAQRVDDFPDKDPDVLRIRAVAEQFRWTFHYAGPDGMIGLTATDRITSSNGIGLMKEDLNGHDDFITSNTLILPKDRNCIVQVTSKDVIHGLHLVPLQSQQDAIPGREIPMWFKATKTGEWDVVCAQLCGAGHAKMAATMEVLEREDFDQWFAGQKPNVFPQEAAPAE